MIRITETPEGVVISVRAQPGAKRTTIVGIHGNALKVAVHAPPVDGKANEAIEVALAGWLGLKKSQVGLKSGMSSRDKTFLLGGIDASSVQILLDALVPIR
jgi:uncharacterized protein (TIGR00251 family)